MHNWSGNYNNLNPRKKPKEKVVAGLLPLKLQSEQEVKKEEQVQ